MFKGIRSIQTIYHSNVKNQVIPMINVSWKVTPSEYLRHFTSSLASVQLSSHTPKKKATQGQSRSSAILRLVPAGSIRSPTLDGSPLQKRLLRRAQEVAYGSTSRRRLPGLLRQSAHSSDHLRTLSQCCPLFDLTTQGLWSEAPTQRWKGTDFKIKIYPAPCPCPQVLQQSTGG